MAGGDSVLATSGAAGAGVRVVMVRDPRIPDELLIASACWAEIEATMNLISSNESPKDFLTSSNEALVRSSVAMARSSAMAILSNSSASTLPWAWSYASIRASFCARVSVGGLVVSMAAGDWSWG